MPPAILVPAPRKNRPRSPLAVLNALPHIHGQPKTAAVSASTPGDTSEFAEKSRIRSLLGPHPQLPQLLIQMTPLQAQPCRGARHVAALGGERALDVPAFEVPDRVRELGRR